MNGMYEELIDKLRKNNRMSGWTHIDRLMDDAIKAIEALQQEIEQLADETIKLMRENAQNSMRVESLTAEKDELIKVLKQARKALYAARVDVLTKETDELARDAVEAINALIGREKDA